MPTSTDAFSTIAQLGLGLAGFSGVAIVLGRGEDAFPRFQRYRLGIMLGTSLGATFLALVPLILVETDLGAATGMRVASAVMVAFTVVFLAYYLSAIHHMRSTVPEIVSRTPFGAALAGHGANLIGQMGVVVGLLDGWKGVYLAGLAWLLLHGAYQFGRILFIRPRS